MEAQAWKQAYGRSLNAHYRTKMEKIVHFVTEYQKRLSRPVQDLEDVRLMMAALAEIRDGEIGIDVELIPVEVRAMRAHACTHVLVVLHVQVLAADRLLLQECYAFLQRCNISVPREEMEKVDSLRYSFNNIMTQSVSHARHRQWIPHCMS